MCAISGCGKKHIMYIHMKGEPGVRNTVDNSSNGNSVCNQFSHMPIVQVLVKDSLTLYALLDSSPNNYFCPNKIVKKLNLNGESVNYFLNTLNQ